MVRIADCDACQIGRHDKHVRTVRAVPEGVLGGVMCPCQGECVKDAAARQERFLRRLGLPLNLFSRKRA